MCNARSELSSRSFCPIIVPAWSIQLFINYVNEHISVIQKKTYFARTDLTSSLIETQRVAVPHRDVNRTMLPPIGPLSRRVCSARPASRLGQTRTGPGGARFALDSELVQPGFRRARGSLPARTFPKVRWPENYPGPSPGARARRASNAGAPGCDRAAASAARREIRVGRLQGPTHAAWGARRALGAHPSRTVAASIDPPTASGVGRRRTRIRIRPRPRRPSPGAPGPGHSGDRRGAIGSNPSSEGRDGGGAARAAVTVPAGSAVVWRVTVAGRRGQARAARGRTDAGPGGGKAASGREGSEGFTK